MQDRPVQDSPAQKSPIFIGGAGRSGTTLLRVILDSHPHIACGPELKMLPLISSWWYECQTRYSPYLQNYQVSDSDVNAMFAVLIHCILDKHRNHQGKQRSAEKTPNNVMCFAHLHKMFPDSPFIHVIRDGRDVIASLLTMDWKNQDGKAVDYTRDATAAAHYWIQCIQSGRKFRQSLTAGQTSYMEIRYEDIINKPDSTLKLLLAFIGEPWTETLLDFHNKPRHLAGESSAGQVSQPIYTNALNRWQNDLTEQQKQQIKPVIGDTLIELGYAQDNHW